MRFEVPVNLLKLKKMKSKKIDCVALMRRIRDKHYAEYEKNPSLRKKRLEAIRKKYGIKETEMQAGH